MTIWPSAILCVDADAFFASVVQAVNPHLKGKPIATGKERGVAIAVSYEAKKYGVTRCMTASEIRRLCPSCIIVNSEYRLYHIFSSRMFSILRKFSPRIEEYSIDEGFVDIAELPTLYNRSYTQIGAMIKQKIESSLGITVSVGISPTKSLSKLASNFKKPSGLVVVAPETIPSFLKEIQVKSIWGVGESIGNKMQRMGIKTAYDFICHDEAFIKQNYAKPQLEIWRELQGIVQYPLNTEEKITYQSISKVQTFGPPTNNQFILWARLRDRVEDAFQKAREYRYDVGKLIVYLKTQQFTYQTAEIKLPEKISFPHLIKDQMKQAFKIIYKRNCLYRATGCVLTDLQEQNAHQLSLFADTAKEEKMKKIYPLYEKRQIAFGTSLYDEDLLHKHKKKTKIPMISI